MLKNLHVLLLLLHYGWHWKRSIYYENLPNCCSLPFISRYCCESGCHDQWKSNLDRMGLGLTVARCGLLVSSFFKVYLLELSLLQLLFPLLDGSDWECSLVIIQMNLWIPTFIHLPWPSLKPVQLLLKLNNNTHSKELAVFPVLHS